MAFQPFYVNGPPYGGLVGDVHDAARFLALHLGDGAVGSKRLLTAESAAAMRTLTTRGKKLTTGLGWWHRHAADDGSGLVEHLGGGGAYRNLMRLYPNAGQAVVMFGNLTNYPVERLTATVLTSGARTPWDQLRRRRRRRDHPRAAGSLGPHLITVMGSQRDAGSPSRCTVTGRPGPADQVVLRAEEASRRVGELLKAGGSETKTSCL